MKKVFGILFGLAFLALFVWTGVFLYRKSQKPPVVFTTASPERTTIVKKTVATGSVLPRKEIALKPVVSGIVEELFVEAGQTVQQGDLIARIRLIPNMVSLSAAESRANKAQIALDNARRDLERNQRLFEDGTISAASFQQFELAVQTAEEEVQASIDNLDLIRKGTSERRGNATNTLVRATIGGTVLEVPVEVGTSVIESNNFNEGTTIAALADMDDMIFEGKVDESEVGKIRAGMELVLTIGAVPDRQVRATLEHVAPKGVEENGAIQFEIRAALLPQEDLFIRANYSANADIVLDRRDDVLAIEESLLQFDQGKPFVEVETAPQQFERREITTGLSDGIKIEVLSGLTETDKIKNPNPDARAASGPPGAGGRGAATGQARPPRRAS
jgi:HlyD family secretion protein